METALHWQCTLLIISGCLEGLLGPTSSPGWVHGTVNTDNDCSAVTASGWKSRWLRKGGSKAPPLSPHITGSGCHSSLCCAAQKSAIRGHGGVPYEEEQQACRRATAACLVLLVWGGGVVSGKRHSSSQSISAQTPPDGTGHPLPEVQLYPG